MGLKQVYNSTPYLILEFLFFYVFVPFLASIFFDGWLKVIPLVLIAIFFLALLLNDSDFDNRIIFRFDRLYVVNSLTRVVLISLLLLWFTYWIFPDLFFHYPVENLKRYLITLILYPIASVIPQEIIYRVYFFHRYKSIIPEKFLLGLSNAIIFGLTHMIYENWVAPIATFLVSWIFIYNYYQTKSLLNVSLEHYFYGLVMFTVGFGYYFA